MSRTFCRIFQSVHHPGAATGTPPSARRRSPAGGADIASASSAPATPAAGRQNDEAVPAVPSRPDGTDRNRSRTETAMGAAGSNRQRRNQRGKSQIGREVVGVEEARQCDEPMAQLQIAIGCMAGEVKQKHAPARPTTGGTFSIHFSSSPVMIIAEPSRVNTPNQTASAGIKISVTAVTSAPHPNTIVPRLTGWRPSGRQKPDSRMNTQQMDCCHSSPCQLPYHGARTPNR